MKSQAKIQEQIALFHNLQNATNEETLDYWKQKANNYEDIIVFFVELFSAFPKSDGALTERKFEASLGRLRKNESEENLAPERKPKTSSSSGALFGGDFAQKIVSPLTSSFGAVVDGICSSDYSRDKEKDVRSDSSGGERDSESEKSVGKDKKKRILRRHSSNPNADFVTRVSLTSDLATERSGGRRMSLVPKDTIDRAERKKDSTEKVKAKEKEKEKEKEGKEPRSRSKERSSTSKIEKREASRERDRPKISRLETTASPKDIQARALELRKEGKPRTQSVGGPMQHAYPIVKRAGEDAEQTAEPFAMPAHGKFGRKKINRAKTAHVSKWCDKFQRNPAFTLQLVDTAIHLTDQSTFSALVEEQPVILNLKNDHRIVIEVPQVYASDAICLYQNVDYYKDYFFGHKHLVWVALEHATRAISIVTVLPKPESPNRYRALINSRKGFKPFEVSFPLDVVVPQGDAGASLISQNLKSNANYSYVRLKDFNSFTDIFNIEFDNRQEVVNFQVSVIYCKPGQSDPQEMFQNRVHSAQFDQFIKAMGVPEELYVQPFDEDNSKYNSVALDWHDKHVFYLLSSRLNDEENRRLIGNTQAVIFFKDDETSFDPSQFDQMGSVPQFFAVVRPRREGGYQVGFFTRVNLNLIEPFIPANSVLDDSNLRNFLLTKLHNGYMVSRRTPPINRLFELPRQNSINQFAFQHAPRNWLKKQAYDVFRKFFELEESTTQSK